ncbi:hypothetical protein ACKWTF_005690 [Chironomus riparius]
MLELRQCHRSQKKISLILSVLKKCVFFLVIEERFEEEDGARNLRLFFWGKLRARERERDDELIVTAAVRLFMISEISSCLWINYSSIKHCLAGRKLFRGTLCNWMMENK